MFAAFVVISRKRSQMQPCLLHLLFISHSCPRVCSFGDIYLGTNVTTGEEVAMKLESTKRCVRHQLPADVDGAAAVLGDQRQADVGVVLCAAAMPRWS